MAATQPDDSPVTPDELRQLCRRLGHDPERVARLTISPSPAGLRVTVTYIEHVRTMGGAQ